MPSRSRASNRHLVGRILAVSAVLITLAGCASLPENVARPISDAYTDTEDTRFGRERRDEIRNHPGESGFLPLGNGQDAFVARAVLANAAEGSIDAQHYLLHGDLDVVPIGPAVPVESPRDTTYRVEGEPVRLQKGRAVRPAAPGSATAITTQVLGAPTYGDIDGDGDTDAVLFLVQDPGGSGTFYYVAAAHKVDGGYRGGAAVLIGDRITPHRLDIIHGVVVVDYLERAPGEPMAVEPALARTGYLMLEGDALTLVGSLDPGERIVEGWVTIGHEVRSFEPCADPEPHWLSGDSPALDAVVASYREACPVAKPYTPLLMVLAGSSSEPPATGFGADYAAGWRGTRVVRTVHIGDCRSDQIVLELPARGAVVASPLEVRGRARGTWFFEGDFLLVLLDGRGNRVAQGFATAQGEWMTTEFVPFSAVLRFQSPEPGPGRMILKKDNPSDRRELDDALVVPVVFK